MNFKLKYLMVFTPLTILAATFNNHNQTAIGSVKTVVANHKIAIDKFARKYDLGSDELIHANQNLLHKKFITPGTVVVLPTRYILPETKHKGIIINLPEKRMYVYRKNKIYTYPVGIGRQGWATPEGLLYVKSKRKNPNWYVPKAVLAAQKANGVILPAVMPPGPDNPLGKHSIKLSKMNYLIHGTNDPSGVGKRSSAGCIRMYPEDIKQLYHIVYTNMPVHIVNQPFKIKKLKGDWFMESHAPLVEDNDDRNAADGAASTIDLSLDEAVSLVIKSISNAGAPLPNMRWIKDILHNSTGIPTLIAKADNTENFIYELKHHRL